MLPSQEVKGALVRKKADGKIYVIWDVEGRVFTLRDLTGNPGSELVLHGLGRWFDAVPMQDTDRFERVVEFDVVPETPRAAQ